MVIFSFARVCRRLSVCGVILAVYWFVFQRECMSERLSSGFLGILTRDRWGFVSAFRGVKRPGKLDIRRVSSVRMVSVFGYRPPGF